MGAGIRAKRLGPDWNEIDVETKRDETGEAKGAGNREGTQQTKATVRWYVQIGIKE